jgi:hypothetical protein
MSPSDCVKWRIGPWGTSTKPATTTTGMPAASALSVPLRVFDRYASLRFDAECRRSSKVGGAGGPPMATVAHALFRQRTALRMSTSFSLRNCAGPFEVWLLPGTRAPRRFSLYGLSARSTTSCSSRLPTSSWPVSSNYRADRTDPAVRVERFSGPRRARVRLTLRSIVTLVENTSAGSALPVWRWFGGRCGRCSGADVTSAITGSLVAGRLDRPARSARRRAARHG